MKRHMHTRGMTLIELLVAVALFVVIGVALYSVFGRIAEVSNVVRVKTLATTLANEQIEIARNMPYADVGTEGGIPAGPIPQEQVKTRGGIDFTIDTTIRNIDDPFDGTIPDDPSPADSKLVDVTVSCECKRVSPISLTTRVAPKHLETASTNGALVIRVFDADGQPVPQADVHIENDTVSPAVSIDDTTNNNGKLSIVDAPPAVESYEITVSKEGYSTDATYASTDSNPNPIKPHATVVEQEVTQASFTIDEMSTLVVESVSPTCSPVSNLSFELTGDKLIGTNPEVHKYVQEHDTGSPAAVTLQAIEWDTYSLAVTDSAYDLAGMNQLAPISLSPGSEQEVQLVVVASNQPSLLVSVEDAGSGLPVTDAVVTLESDAGSAEEVTGQGVFQQTDWSGGAGQQTYTNEDQYASNDGNIADSDPAGTVSLQEIAGEYTTDGTLTSSTFDTGSGSNFHEIQWEPYTQPTSTGDESVRLQIATNTDESSWTYRGPDGTTGSYYTPSNRALANVHDDDRYVRYRTYLETDDTSVTPSISDVAITFTSSCTPPGQVLFSDLATGSYTITVERSGYETYSEPLTIESGWQEESVELNPS